MEEIDTTFLKNACLFDNQYFRLFFKDHPNCMKVVIQSVFSQLNIDSNIKIRSMEMIDVECPDNVTEVGFDSEVEMGTGETVFVHVQVVSGPDLMLRARYFSALLDQKCLAFAGDCDDMPDSYVIFITKEDIFKDGHSLYQIERKVSGAGSELFNDGSHVIWVNAEVDDGSIIAKLMQDFKRKDSVLINNDILRIRTDYLKAGYASGVGKAINEEAFAKGYAEGFAKQQAEDIHTLLRSLNGDYEAVAKLLQMPVSEIRRIANIRLDMDQK